MAYISSVLSTNHYRYTSVRPKIVENFLLFKTQVQIPSITHTDALVESIAMAHMLMKRFCAKIMYFGPHIRYVGYIGVWRWLRFTGLCRRHSQILSRMFALDLLLNCKSLVSVFTVICQKYLIFRDFASCLTLLKAKRNLSVRIWRTNAFTYS